MGSYRRGVGAAEGLPFSRPFCLLRTPHPPLLASSALQTQLWLLILSRKRFVLPFPLALMGCRIFRTFQVVRASPDAIAGFRGSCVTVLWLRSLGERGIAESSRHLERYRPWSGRVWMHCYAHSCAYWILTSCKPATFRANGQPAKVSLRLKPKSSPEWHVVKNSYSAPQNMLRASGKKNDR